MRLLLAILAVAFAACQVGDVASEGAADPAIAREAMPAGLTLSQTATADSLRVELSVGALPGERPRLMELHLKPTANLRFTGAEALDAAIDSGKALHVLPRGDTLRVVLMATDNLNPIGEGPLARLTFERLDAAPAEIVALERGPVFAPAAANHGVALPKPLRVGGE